MSILIRQALLLAVALGCLACGCATTITTRTDALPQKRPKLLRTQAGDQVTLQWESHFGSRYTVIYTADLQDPNQWRVLPGFEDIAGSGGTQVVTFQAPQPGRLYYRLNPMAAASQ